MSKSISCHVRVRPPAPTDGKVNPEGIVIQENKISAMSAQGDKRYHFEIEKCHGESSTQEEVFEHVAPLLDQAWAGTNTTIFAYGVTGAGKTHTMQGTRSDPGLIPRTVQAVFERRSLTQSSTVRISFSYVEILKDEVYDLLGSQTEARKRDIRMNAEGQNVVADLIVQPVDSQAQFNQIYDAAIKTRKTASTKLNSNSSRSHAILTLYMETTDDATGMMTMGKICLTDLAGSENNNLTGNDRERMRESSAINTSLTTLGKVVDALNVNAQRGSTDGSGVFVPYRESKLTRLLQDALGGTSQGLLICCLAPGEKFARDTINTLQFGKKSKTVENRLNNNEQNRRLSHPIQPSQKTTQPQVPFKVYSGPRPSALPRASLGGRTALSVVAPNTRYVKTLGTKAVLDNGKLKGEKENIAAGMTDEQLEKRIHKIVNQEMASAREKERLLDLAQPSPQVVEPVIEPVASDAQAGQARHDLQSMTEEEKDNRAKVIVHHARKLHQSGDLVQALGLYKKAYEYVPANHKLSMRITEIQLAIEGILPPPQLSSTSHSSRDSISSRSHLKRSRVPTGYTSLAELSYEAEDEGVEETPAKKRKEIGGGRLLQ